MKNIFQNNKIKPNFEFLIESIIDRRINANKLFI